MKTIEFINIPQRDTGILFNYFSNFTYNPYRISEKVFYIMPGDINHKNVEILYIYIFMHVTFYNYILMSKHLN